jgi:hypothetical protein
MNQQKPQQPEQRTEDRDGNLAKKAESPMNEEKIQKTRVIENT